MTPGRVQWHLSGPRCLHPGPFFLSGRPALTSGLTLAQKSLTVQGPCKLPRKPRKHWLRAVFWSRICAGETICSIKVRQNRFFCPSETLGYRRPRAWKKPHPGGFAPCTPTLAAGQGPGAKGHPRPHPWSVLRFGAASRVRFAQSSPVRCSPAAALRMRLPGCPLTLPLRYPCKAR